MKQVVLDLVENRPLTDQVYRLKLVGDCTAVARPGQFVNLKLSGLFLRRPISVYDATAHSLTLVYKTVGKGTRQLSQMRSGSLDVLTGLGNGYDTSLSTARPVLIGGGVGVPPLYLLAKELIKQGKKPRVILGFNTASEVCLPTVPTASSALRSEWAAALGPVWAVPAAPLPAISAFARKAPC